MISDLPTVTMSLPGAWGIGAGSCTEAESRASAGPSVRSGPANRHTPATARGSVRLRKPAIYLSPPLPSLPSNFVSDFFDPAKISMTKGASFLGGGLAPTRRGPLGAVRGAGDGRSLTRDPGGSVPPLMPLNR